MINGVVPRAPAPPTRSGAPGSAAAARLKDPVCGMTVTTASSHVLQVKGQPVYFCGPECKARYAARPARYQVLTPAVGSGPTPATAPAATRYTCPLHLRIRQDQPGACPQCGMALEPLVAASDDDAGLELADVARRFLWSLPLSSAVLLLALAGQHLQWFEMATQRRLEFGLALPVVLWAGWPIFRRALRSLRSRSPDRWLPIGLGTAAAFLYSTAATFGAGGFAASFAVGDGVALYFDAATSIVSLTLLARMFELKARAQAGAAISLLLRLAPKTARRINPDASEEDLLPAALRAGDRLRVAPGEQVPVDGTLEEGAGTVDESMLTGESAAVAKTVGDALLGASRNGSSGLTMRAAQVGSANVLAGIVRMLGQAQGSQAPLQRRAERMAACLVVAVLGVALLCFFGWGWYGPQPGWAHGVGIGLAVLFIACPGALVLATPLSMLLASGAAASRGVLFRDAAAIENLCRVDTLIVDKTATLSEGRPTLTAIRAAAGMSEDQVLRLAASLEQGCDHPLASAIVKAARGRGLALASAAQFEFSPGLGVRGVIDGLQLALGNVGLMSRRGVAIGGLEAQAEALRAKGASVIYLAVDGQAGGILALSDALKPGTLCAVAQLKAGGLRVILASGDSLGTARAVGAELGLTEVRGQQKPADKLALVARLKDEGRVVAMVGDAVNDAAALAAADLAIAIGIGAEVASERAQLTLVKGDLRGIAAARAISLATLANMRQNLAIALVYNALAVPLAAGVLYPVTGALLSPTIAALAMSLCTAAVIANALRLREGVQRRS